MPGDFWLNTHNRGNYMLRDLFENCPGLLSKYRELGDDDPTIMKHTVVVEFDTMENAVEFVKRYRSPEYFNTEEIKEYETKNNHTRHAVLEDESGNVLKVIDNLFG